MGIWNSVSSTENCQWILMTLELTSLADWNWHYPDNRSSHSQWSKPSRLIKRPSVGDAQSSRRLPVCRVFGKFSFNRYILQRSGYAQTCVRQKGILIFNFVHTSTQVYGSKRLLFRCRYASRPFTLRGRDVNTDLSNAVRMQIMPCVKWVSYKKIRKPFSVGTQMPWVTKDKNKAPDTKFRRSSLAQTSRTWQP